MAADGVIQNPDGTITVVKEEVFDVDVLNERLAELEVRAAAVRTDPDCTSTVEEAWGDLGGDLYPQIVKQDSSPGVTFYPDAIPADRTPVLAAEWDDRRPSRPPRLVMRVMMVGGAAPACVGEMFKRVKPLERFTAARQFMSEWLLLLIGLVEVPLGVLALADPGAPWPRS